MKANIILLCAAVFVLSINELYVFIRCREESRSPVWAYISMMLSRIFFMALTITIALSIYGIATDTSISTIFGWFK